MNFRCIEHGVVDSTSERAFAEIAAGTARHGDVHIATEQTAGRGRRGATWHSERGDGLYMSVVLLPPPPPLHAAALTMAGGLAVHDAVRALGLDRVTLKWPNDVVVGPAKLAGVLVETRGLDPARPHYVIGIGVNVRQRSFPRELVAERPVTSLAIERCDVAIDVAREAVLRALSQRLAQVREPATELTRDFLDAARLRDREVSVETASGDVRGRVRELTLERGLVIQRADGGEISFPLEHVRHVMVV